MMLFEEKLLSLADAAKVLPKVNGKHPHTSSLWRWHARGISGVRLGIRKVGSRIFTSREALERFTKAVAEAGPTSRSSRSTPRPRTPERRAKEVAIADAELASAGL